MLRPASRSRRAGAIGAFALLALLSVLAMTSSCEVTVNLNGLEGGCPPPKHGASQVKVTSSDANPFCIDSTETTNAQYAQFVASGSILPDAGSEFTLPVAYVPQGCEALTNIAPSAGWDSSASPPYQTGYDDYPVTNVNWCQAYAYCQWAGKHLCGQIPGANSEGGALAPTSYTDPTQSEWYNVCSLGGTRTYPYSNTFETNACVGNLNVDGGNATLEPVGYLTTCLGGSPGLHDMNGNVWEWTNSCAGPNQMGQSPSTYFCFAMGGAFDSNSATDLSCTGKRNWTRNAGAADIGIRCCLDL